MLLTDTDSREKLKKNILVCKGLKNQNVGQCSLYQVPSILKISRRSARPFSVMLLTYRQTNKQTDKQTDTGENITFAVRGGNKALIRYWIIKFFNISVAYVVWRLAFQSIQFPMYNWEFWVYLYKVLLSLVTTWFTPKTAVTNSLYSHLFSFKSSSKFLDFLRTSYTVAACWLMFSV